MNAYVDDSTGNGDTITFTRADSMNVVAIGGVTPHPGSQGPRPRFFQNTSEEAG